MSYHMWAFRHVKRELQLPPKQSLNTFDFGTLTAQRPLCLMPKQVASCKATRYWARVLSIMADGVVHYRWTANNDYGT